MDENSSHPLAIARAALGLTRVDLAASIREAARRRGLRSGVDRQRVRKWEVAGVTPDSDSQTYIGEVFALPPEEVNPDDWPNWLPSADGGVVPLGPTNSAPALREALRTTMERSRRRFLTAISGTALISLAGTWASTDWAHTAERDEGKAVSADLVSILEETSARLTTVPTEQRQHAAPLLDAHLTTVTNLIADGRYPKPLGLRLHTLACNLSQAVAWHRFDQGFHTEAAKYWIAGLHSAHESDDLDMGAALLGDLAYQASWRDDPGTAAAILERALTRTRHPAARALLHLRLARALAATGERRRTLRALSTAEHLLGAHSSDPVPGWCAWMSEADLAVDSGRSLLDLGDTVRAHQLIDDGQLLLPRARDKTRGVFMAYQAASYLDQREPEAAAATARESLELAQRIGAPRCVDLIQELVPRFVPHRTVTGVPELLDLAGAPR